MFFPSSFCNRGDHFFGLGLCSTGQSPGIATRLVTSVPVAPAFRGRWPSPSQSFLFLCTKFCNMCLCNKDNWQHHIVHSVPLCVHAVCMPYKIDIACTLDGLKKRIPRGNMRDNLMVVFWAYRIWNNALRQLLTNMSSWLSSERTRTFSPPRFQKQNGV